MNVPIVTLEQHGDSAFLSMKWEGIVDGSAINSAFRSLVSYLDAAKAPLSIVFDMSECVRFSAPDALRGALFGPFRHPMLDEWIVIGADSLARNVGRVLCNVTNITNIHWCYTHEQAYSYLSAKLGVDLTGSLSTSLSA